MNSGRLIIISGPSGSGKDTVLSEIFERCPEIEFSISVVTRAMRPGEVQGKKYNFITRKQFEDMISTDSLLEHNIYINNYYGTPREPVEKCISSGKEIIVEIDVNGAAQIREKIKDSLSIFIMPPSMTVLKNRLCGRGTEDDATLAKRIEEAVVEISRADEYDYIVVNDDLDDAVEKCISIIKSDRLKYVRNTDLINLVLNG